ncbi:marine proteobacterial sortase target protein [Opitutales bacterium ASA1]|uniref:VIT and vWA domain-containing protein n=1 Tax=Congregicoccus parvus TaxID=3081749 RepID=UPI002B31AC82|nr:marine proteobacterial sortase target protein [Opitutales bacterium ASA1]
MILRPVTAILLACLVFSPAHARNEEPPDPPPGSAPFFVVTSPTPPGHDVLPLVDTHVEVTVAGTIAEVSVVQTYANKGPTALEAVYVFPGSTRAAVHGLVMYVGDRVVRARIQPRGEARRTYEQARAEGKTTTLLEQERPNLFRMNLAGIQPGDVVRVELRYTETLACEENEYEFVFPTAVGPRYSRDGTDVAASTSAPATDATLGFRMRLAPGVPLRELRCVSHPVVIDEPRTGEARLELDPAIDPATHVGRDIVVRYRLSGDTPAAGLLFSRPTDGGEGWFLATIQPPTRVAPAEIPLRDYVFVVDVSGSMHGFPIATTVLLLRELIASLDATDTFNVLFFAGGSEVLSPHPLAATPENLARAVVLLESRPAGGGTELLPALQTAFDLPADPLGARTIVVVTDGFVEVEPEAFALVRARLGDASLFAFGIGASVNRHLIEALARAGRGEPEFVLSAREAPEAAARFRRRIDTPVLVDLAPRFDGIAVADVSPAPLPDLFASRPIVLSGRWSGVPAGRIHLRGRTGAGPWQTTLDFADAVDVTGSRALELLWARSRIADLEDADSLGRDPARVAEITRLGLAHGLLTKHTSFVAVDERIHSPGTTDESSSPGNSAAGVEVPTTPEPGTLGLALLLSLGLGIAWWKRR